MGSNHSRWFQIAMVILTVVCALAVGYFTGMFAGGGAGAPIAASTSLPPLVEATVEADETAVSEPALTDTPALAATTAASATPTPSLAPSATPTMEPTTEPSTVFIEDTFDTPVNNWPTGETETWSAGFVDGRYQLKLNGQTSIGFTTQIPADNYRLSVDVAVTQGGAGVVFLFTEPATSYRIVFSPDGAYAIERQEGNASTQENVVTKIVDWTASDALQTTPGVDNRLTIERQGTQVRFIVNDQLLTDFSVPPGPFVNRYGFVLTSRTGQGAATFDNLRGESLPGS